MISTKSRKLMKSIVTLVNKNDQTFRECHYVIVNLKFITIDEFVNVCLNIDCSITINDKQTLIRYAFNLKIKKLTSSISIRDIDNIMHYIFDYVVMSCYMNDYLSNNNRISTTSKFEVEFHLIKDLKTNLLIDNDVLIAQRVKIDLISQSVQLNNCQNLVASIDTITRKNSNLKRIIRAKQIINVFVNFIVKMFITYHDNLSNDRNFLFESQCAQQQLLNTNENVFVYIINASLNNVMIQNVNNYVV